MGNFPGKVVENNNVIGEFHYRARPTLARQRRLAAAVSSPPTESREA